MLLQRAARGARTPALEQRVEPWPSLRWVWKAFHVLHAGRVVQWAPHPIPLTEIEAYCRLHGIEEPETRAELVRLIRVLDAAWLRWAEAQRAREPTRATDGKRKVRRP